jgi:hypothetical protein
MYSPLTLALPIPPADVMERFSVHEPLDTRFRACARLLQALWRERRSLPIGSYARSETGATPLGSRLAGTPARAGLNYLTADIARQVRRELAYRERGALIDEARAWENLLSSSALTFNLLAPLKLNPTLAKAVLKAVLSIDIKAVEAVCFETSPGRGDNAYIGDHTALDALIIYIGKDGKRGFVGVEVKYAESSPTNATPVKPRLMELADRSGVFVDAANPDLRQPTLRQFFAEHMLCYSMIEQGLFERGQFIVIAPTLNHEMATALNGYASKLASAHSGILPFTFISLEAMTAAICDAGEPDLARALDERYLDFSPIYDLIDDWTPHSIPVNAAAE